VVIKLGTSIVTNEVGGFSTERIGPIAREIAVLKREGRQVVLESSGAVGLGAGRLGLPRERRNDVVTKQACAAVGQSLLMHAYEQLFRSYDITIAQILLTEDDFADWQRYQNLRRTIYPIMVPACEKDGFKIPSRVLEHEVVSRGIEAFVLSNPCNPTGSVIRGEELRRYLEIARDFRMTLVLDEFYSHFIYDPDGSPGLGPVSGAAFVEEVDKDPVLLIDGLTKSFRYPGWRIGWAVGPAAMVETLGRAASAIDGGPSQPIQRAALEVLKPERAESESQALRQVFARKRNLMAGRLKEMGIRCSPEPEGTFYCWASLKELPAPLNDGETFFRQALKHKVITVPGVFFDVNPGKRRHATSNFRSWMRFSFGPTEDNVREGLDRLEKMLTDARSV